MQTRATRLYLIRHGEVYNPNSILYGRLPRFPLSPKGFRQALATGRFLKNRPIEAIFSSPLLRARQTAERILSCHHGLKLRISSHLNEVYTSYEGRPGAEVDARNGDLYSGSAACYEQPFDLVKRVRIFIARILKQHAGGEVVAVTHGDIIVFTVLWAQGFELHPLNKTRLKQAGYATDYPENAAITTLTFSGSPTHERPQIEYANPASDEYVHDG